MFNTFKNQARALTALIPAVLLVLLLLIFGCKKEEEQKDPILATNEIYSAELGSLKVTVNGESAGDNAQVAILEAVSSNGEMGIKLDNIIRGYEEFLLPCTKADNSYTGNRTIGNRSISVSATVKTGTVANQKTMEMTVIDKNTAGFTDKKWMIASTTDRVPSREMYSALPDIRLRTNIGDISIPGRTPINLQEVFANIESNLREKLAKPHTVYVLNPQTQVQEQIMPYYKWISICDYLVFSSDGKVGLGFDQKHATSYFTAVDQAYSSGASYDEWNFNTYTEQWGRIASGASPKQIYDNLPIIVNPLSSKPVIDLLDINSEHCLLRYFESEGYYSGVPVVYIEGDWFGEAIINTINDFLTYGLYSSLQVPAEFNNFPIQITCSEKELVLGYDLNAIVPVLKALNEKLADLTWDEFRTEILPGWASINELLSSELSFDLFTEENLNLFKAAVNAVVVFFSQEGRELSIEAHFVPYTKELRPWEDPKTY